VKARANWNALSQSSDVERKKWLVARGLGTGIRLVPGKVTRDGARARLFAAVLPLRSARLSRAEHRLHRSCAVGGRPDGTRGGNGVARFLLTFTPLYTQPPPVVRFTSAAGPHWGSYNHGRSPSAAR